MRETTQPLLLLLLRLVDQKLLVERKRERERERERGRKKKKERKRDSVPAALTDCK